ncbi:FAD-binding protein [Campylobacter coli]
MGKEWVFKTHEDLDLYRDAYSPQWDDDDEPIPSLALAPKNVEEVQAIVKIANEFKIPLFPISTGKNLGYGSYVDGLFSQSNFGIVTKMGFWMMPKPEHYMLLSIKMKKREDLIPAVEILNYLEDSFIVGWPQYFSPLNPPYGKPMNAELKGYLTSKNGLPDMDKIQNYALKNKIPYWNIDVSVYGCKEVCYANLEYIKQRFKIIEGVDISIVQEFSSPLNLEQKKQLKHKVTLGIPNMEIFWLSTRGEVLEPSDEHVWFSPIIPRDGKELLKCQEVYMNLFREFGEESPITPFSHPRSWMYRAFCFMLAFNNSRTDKAHN